MRVLLEVCIFSGIFSSVGLLAQAEDTNDPPALYLTWQQDPTTTMTVNWLLTNNVESRVYYRLAGSNESLSVQGKHHPLPASDRTVYQVELTRLASHATYEFCFTPEEKVFRFRTMPQPSKRR